MTKVKCFFRFISDEDKKKFKKSSCLFTISVGQQSHENEQFDATIDLINDSFSNCIMLVDDSLQRHTMAFNSKNSSESFYDLSIKEGDLWLERNKHYYSKLRNLKRIIRWDTWLNHNNFKAKKEMIENRIDCDEDYRNAFESSANAFIKKYKERILNKEDFDVDRAIRISLEFIKEECIALCLWKELGCEYEVYPGVHNAAIQKTREIFLVSHEQPLLKAVTLGFRNVKQFSPQSFVLVDHILQR
jgi:hypothetical protein